MSDDMLLSKASIGQKSCIERIEGTDKKKRFLTSLGCCEGEFITLVSILAGNYVVNIKDSRYAIDERMARQIVLSEKH
jgi:ferrous iron transport protein A